MKTSVSGYPRIGRKRELKFAVEGYFKGELDGAALEAAGRAIRLDSWRTQRDAGISFIPSNDFSFYDNMLDAALLFGVVPGEYAGAGLSPLELMFAMARGHQGKDGVDLKALPMRKWFNTNYHYIVPVFEDGTIPELSGTKPPDEFKEALDAGISTRPVIVGPFTFLKLAQFTGKKRAIDFADALSVSYVDLLRKLASVGAAWLQFDEPSLVTDLDAEDIRLIHRLYGEILPSRGSIKVHLNAPYGDLRDCYEEIVALDFDGIGLDFVEGPGNLDLLRRNAFPRDTTLTVGLVDGKNIWRSDDEKLLGLLREIADASGCAVSGGRLEIGTSCSLIHVPLSLSFESKLAEDTRFRLSFAEEKLSELTALAAAAEGGEGRGKRPALRGEAWEDAAVRARVAALADGDFTRKTDRAERRRIQQERFKLPPLPTTTIGSFPQTAEVRELRARLRKGALERGEYDERIKGLIADCVALQEEMGFDVLVHGEFERNDMVEFFGQNLKGFAFTSNGWVQSYGTRCVKPPIIVSDISRARPLTVELAVYAQSLSKKPVKGMLTGPVTILNWSFPREDLSLRDSAFQIALAIRDEVLDLERNGIGIIQIDEAALREKMPLRRADRKAGYLDWAIPAFRLTHAAVKSETQIHTHMCYSDFTEIVSEIDAMDADVITFEAARSNMEILDYLVAGRFETAVGPGLYDIHSPRVPSAAEIETAIETILRKTGAPADRYEGVWVNPDCGLKTRTSQEVVSSLRNLVAAARKVRAAHQGAA